MCEFCCTIACVCLCVQNVSYVAFAFFSSNPACVEWYHWGWGGLLGGKQTRVGVWPTGWMHTGVELQYRRIEGAVEPPNMPSLSFVVDIFLLCCSRCENITG